MSATAAEEERAQVLNAYKAKVREHREMESRQAATSSFIPVMRGSIRIVSTPNTSLSVDADTDNDTE